MSASLQARDITVRTGQTLLVDGLSLSLERPGLTGLLGPNGSGKSTFLRTLYRALKPHTGAVLLNGQELWQIPSGQVARQLAVVAQERPLEHAFTVRDVVTMGRLPHQHPLRRTSEQDHVQVDAALARLDLLGLAHREFETLSGGEKQRTLIARAVAQEAQVLLLDEPTNHLDIRYQLEVLGLLRALHLPVLVALHDLNLAAMACDDLLLIQEGRQVTHGSPAEVLRPETIREMYGVEADVTVSSRGHPLVTFQWPESFAQGGPPDS